MHGRKVVACWTVAWEVWVEAVCDVVVMCGQFMLLLYAYISGAMLMRCIQIA